PDSLNASSRYEIDAALSHARSHAIFFHYHPPTRPLPSFPTRRSSDLIEIGCTITSCRSGARCRLLPCSRVTWNCGLKNCRNRHLDRKSTRLNSSHGSISYAVFCLKKKKMTYINTCEAQFQHRQFISM